MRLYGKGGVIQSDNQQWHHMVQHFLEYKAVRQIIVLNMNSLQATCGYGVPIMGFVKEKPTLVKLAEGKTKEQLKKY